MGWLLKQCQQDGSWAQESIEGVFNKNVAISYPNFKFSFTIWMLGKAHKYLADLRPMLMVDLSDGFHVQPVF